MRLLALALSALVVCAGGASAAPRGPGAVAPLEDRAIMMNGFYMGNLTSHWRIEPDGSGEYWRDTASPSGTPTGRLEKYRGHLPPAHRAALLAAIARFRSGAIRHPRCRNAVHDAPSLAIRWGAGAREVADAYLGCMDAQSRNYGQQVIALDAIVERHFVRSGAAFAVENVTTTPAY